MIKHGQRYKLKSGAMTGPAEDRGGYFCIDSSHYTRRTGYTPTRASCLEVWQTR